MNITDRLWRYAMD